MGSPQPSRLPFPAGVIGLVVYFAALLVIGCSASEDVPGTSVTLGGQSFSDAGTADVRSLATIEMKAGTTTFTPTFLRGTPGQRLRVRIRNVSTIPHTFTVPAQGLDVRIPTGRRPVEIEITFPRKGAALFICTEHPTFGMAGQLLAGDTTPQPFPAWSPLKP